MGKTIAAILLGFALTGVFPSAVAEPAGHPGADAGPAPTRSGSAPLAFSRSTAGFASERGAASKRSPDLLEDFEPLDEAAAPDKDSSAMAQKFTVPCCDFRIFAARVWLYDDRDGDGYFTYFRVSFDVDTDYSEAHIYARLFLRGADGVWNFLYETEVFPIFGSAGTDEYEIETELVSGYPTGAYDVLIKVYDASYGDLVTQYGPRDTSALSVTPLEDLSYDGLPPPPVSISRGSSGGGVVSLELLGLALVAGWASRRVRGPGTDRRRPRVSCHPSACA